MSTLSKKVYIKTYGCQMQVYDSDKMEALLKPFGYEISDDQTTANLVILNTCNIREKAEQKVLSELGRLKAYKKAQEALGQEYLIAVGGCVAQAQGAEILRQAPYVSIVFSPQNYHRLPEYLTKAKRHNGKVVETEFPVESKFDYLPEVTPTRASVFLTIQEGCDKFCTFCVVPYTRGSEYSRPVQDIVNEAKLLVSKGALEITMLGQNVSAYHGAAPIITEAQNEWRLGQLLEELAKIDGLKRLRYTTSHPNDMDDHLLSTHGSIEKLMPHLHLPVQSGSNKLLKLMNRKHTIELYYDIIAKLKNYRKDILITSDFITGHPGESAQDHQDTMKVIHDLIDTGYSFTYSPRPGTPASAMEQISEDLKRERLCEVQELLRMKQLMSHKNSEGKIQEVLVERIGKAPGQLLAKNEYCQSVCFNGPENLINQIVKVKINNGYQHSLEGVLL